MKSPKKNIFTTAYTKVYLRLTYLIFFMIYLISCQDVQKPEIPANLIPQEDMVGILTDVYVSNAARNVNNKLLRNKNIKLDSVIFIKYKVDSLQFALSNDYYSSNLDIYRELLIKVQEKLKVLQTEKDSIYKVVTRQDSIINSLKREAVKKERKTGSKKIRD